MDKRIALLGFALLSARVWAEDLPELKETVVTASRVPTDLLDSPSFVTVITPQEIEESGASDVAGVLAQQSGVVINDSGTDGSVKTVSIRGSTSSQVLVLVDGIRLNSSLNGIVDLSKLPLDNVDHIEVVRGGASSLWGTGAVGGVINIITKKPGEPSLNLGISNGSYLPHDSTAVTETGSSPVPASAMSLLDNQRVTLSMSGRLGEVGLTGGGSFTRAANAFVWDDTASLEDWRQRNNAQDLAQNAYAGLELPALDGSLSFKGSFDHSLIGVPGSAIYPTSQANQEDTSLLGSFSFATQHFFTDALTLDVKGSYHYAQETYNDPLYPSASVYNTNSATLDLTQKFLVTDWVSAVYGANSSYEVADSSNLSGRKDRLTLAGFLSMPFLPLQSLTVTPSLRYDYYSDFSGHLSYQLAAVLSLSDQTSLKASFGTAYRAPTLEDLYYYLNDPVYGLSLGNPNLKPETSYSGEIGAAYVGQWLSVETSLFTRLVYDQIFWDFSQYPSTPINIGESLQPGAEAHATVKLIEGLTLEVNYTFIYSLLLQYPGVSLQLADNKRVPYVPVHNLDLTARFKTGIHTFSAELEYAGQKFTDAANTGSTALPAYVVLNAGYRIAATDSIVFSVALRNILNTLYYEQSGYPMPPFSVVTGMNVKL